MDQNFQTSFIPKKPIIEERVVYARPVNIFTVGASLILFAVLLGSGGLYFYKGTLKNEINKKAQDLELAKNRFEPARIAELQVLDKRLRASNEILTKHIAISPIFKALEGVTLPSVSYTHFSYILGVPPVTSIMV